MHDALENPWARSCVGFASGLVIVLLAARHLEGTARTAAYGLAVLDAIVVPFALQAAVEVDGSR